MQLSRRSLYFDLSVFFCSLTVLAYFGWHAFYGPRSVEHEKYIQTQVVKYQAERIRVEALREKINSRVALLRPQSIDPDMLEEMARKTLQFAAKSDFVVVNK